MLSNLYCTPKQTVTLNKDGWGNEMTYEAGNKYEYRVEINGTHVVYLGKGYLCFHESEFSTYFDIV